MFYFKRKNQKFSGRDTTIVAVPKCHSPSACRPMNPHRKGKSHLPVAYWNLKSPLENSRVPSQSWYLWPKCAKTHLWASVNSIFFRGLDPRTPVKRGRGCVQPASGMDAPCINVYIYGCLMHSANVCMQTEKDFPGARLLYIPQAMLDLGSDEVTVVTHPPSAWEWSERSLPARSSCV